MAGRPKKHAVPTESSFDDAFEVALEVAQKAYPDNVFTGGEESMRCICLPVPGLAPRVLLQQEGWPESRFYLLDGPQESCKSAFGYEVIHWNRLARGKGIVIEVEDKKSPELCLSINNYDAKAWTTHFCDTMEGWNGALTYWIKKFAEIMDGNPKAPKSKPGIGRISPVCFMVDSIMAAVGDDLMAEAVKEGSVGRHFATDTGMLSDFMKIFTKWLPGYPFTVIGVNHLKPTQDKRGFAVRHMPGGKAPGYHATIDIEMRKVKEAKRAKDEYIRLQMETKKNSAAPKNWIEVDMIWYIDLDHPTQDGECLQRTYFDWDTASIGCIIELMNDGGEERRKRLKELVGLDASIEKRTVSSDVLGIGDPISWHEAGKVLEQRIQSDKEFRDLLYPLMGVRRRHLFRSGVDYRVQMDEARTEALRAQALREEVIQKTTDERGNPNTDVAPLDTGEDDVSPLDIS